jgi:acyl-coenzyme A synthetase/AMP-(fatty) acid ligase/thioesterase domain-containing protein/acyl carrier protein
MALNSLRGDTNSSVLDDSAPAFRTFAWLDDDPHPLDWNGPANRLFARFHNQDLQRPIIGHLERVARRQPGRIAIREANTSLTYGELWDGVSGLAETLSARTKPGDLICILLPAGPMFALTMLACLASGCPFVALDVHDSPEWLDHVLEDARPALTITGKDGLQTDRVVPVISLTGVPRPARRGWRPSIMGVDEPACVLFSSGSTARPKSIVNSQRNLLQRVAQSINAGHINPADRLLTLASPSTIVGVRDVITALLAGARIHLLNPQSTGAREIWNVIREEAITILFAFPALLRSVAPGREEGAGASLRLVRVGGDTTLWSDIGALRAWLAPEAFIQLIYAATEAPMMQWFVDDSCRRDDARIPIGYPLPGNRLAVVDEEGCATPAGEVGELIVASPYVSLGRWMEGRLSDEDVEAGGGRGCRVFHTGDLVRQRPDGLLERVGRKDRQVKIRGSRVDLDGIEAMLRGQLFVQDVGVVARPNWADGTFTLVAYVSAREGASPGLIGELKAFLRSAPPPMRPARFYLVPSIPRLPSSKLNIRALAALDEASVQRERAQSERSESMKEAGLAPMGNDPISRTVARLWQKVLFVPVRAGEDDFFDTGGDSLKAMTFAIELERALGFEVSLTLIHESPGFDQLCQALRERRAPGSVPLVTLKAGDGRPPVFFIHGVGGSVVPMLPASRRVTYPGPVIGIRARGVVRGEKPHISIEAMATDYLRAIKQRQPKGPYYLCGYSSGGLVAVEIARRLSESGEEVGLVGLFDTTMSPLRWPLRAWVSIIARHIAVFAKAVARTPIRTWPAKLRQSVQGLRPLRAPSIGIRVPLSHLVASARYHPEFYRGNLTLFSPVGREPGLPSLESVWAKHAQTVAVVVTEGDHRTMLSTLHAETTAACLARCLYPADERS